MTSGTAPVPPPAGGRASAVGPADGAPETAAPDGAPQLRAAVVGMSEGATCGARDHAALLASALPQEDVSCTMHWLERTQDSPRAAFSEIGAWTRQLAGELAAREPDAVLLHYSAFSYAHRGVPLFVRPVLSALRGSRVPVVTILHEYAYPWRAGDWRGNVWALTQRAALIDVIGASSAAVVTADFRVAWLASRPWLPKRPIVVAPVFSNLPSPNRAQTHERDGRVIGLFGYSYESAAVSLVIDALATLLERGLEVQLRLLGAPGRTSAAGEAWQAAAEAAGASQALSFTGVLSAQDLSNALASCDGLVFADSPGPTSRKGTLAASLASGRPVVAIDGPRTWPELTDAQAAHVVEPSAQALADGLQRVLSVEAFREALGVRGRAFAEQRMGVARTAEVVAELIGQVLSGRASSPASA